MAQVQSDRKGVHAPTYRWAILNAMAGLHDYHTRSKVPQIRRRAMELFAEKDYSWNEGVFLQTLKAMKEKHDISMEAFGQAEISPTLKKKIVDFAEHRIEIDDPLTEPMSEREF